MTEPVDYIVVGFTRPEQVLAGFDRLAALAEADSVRIVDAEFIHSIMGNPSTIPAHQVHPDLTGYEACDTRLLGQSDLDTVTDVIASGSMAAVILLQARWRDTGWIVLAALLGRLPASTCAHTSCDQFESCVCQ